MPKRSLLEALMLGPAPSDATPMIIHQLRHKELRDEARFLFENRPPKRVAGESATLQRQYRVPDLEPQSHGP